MVSIPTSQHNTANRGFTMVEMVTVIVILGVLAVGVSSFIVLGSRIYVNSTSVDQVLSESRFALERITREIRGAVPNSLRLRSDGANWLCLEFVPIQASSSYVDMPILPDPKATTGVGFIDPSSTVTNSQMVLIYPLNAAEVYTDPDLDTGKLFALNAATITETSKLTLTFDRPVQFSEGSPMKRMYFVSQPISYCFILNGATSDLYRYTGYGINNTTQPAPTSMGPGILMAEKISNNLLTDPPVSLTSSTLVNNAMVLLTPEFTAIDQTFKYQQQIQVINAP